MGRFSEIGCWHSHRCEVYKSYHTNMYSISHWHLFRYDYCSDTQMLIIEFPSTLHKAGVKSLTSLFQHSAYELDVDNNHLWKHWCILSGKENQYGDLTNQGTFTADALFEVKNLSVLLFEVSFPQVWQDLFSKANHLLNSLESVLGVVVMNIMEHPRWSKPNQCSKLDDFIGN